MRRTARCAKPLLLAFVTTACLACGDGETDAGSGDKADAGHAHQDAGGDVAAADSSVVDAGAADTTVADAGSTDIGPSDGGVADIGVADGGVADIGALDIDEADIGALDIGPADIGAQDIVQPDASGGDTGKPACPDKTPYDYKCDALKPKTCPGGICTLGLCLGPKLDQDRWKDCGDGTCGPCEDAKGCPADCGKPPKMSGKKVYDGAKTITIWVHGFYNKDKAELAKMTYGAVDGCGGVYKMFKAFGIDRPCGEDAKGAAKPNHVVGVEYYGAKPAAWLSKDDIKAIDKWPFDKGALGLQRYALVVAKFARWRMKLSGATHVNFGCHSMGCLITRHLIENDYEKLASDNVIVRWATNTGVIAGARLARLYDNPDIQKIATSLGLELSDFVLMNPDNVMDVTAVWDHKLYAGNNPLFKGVLMHHTAATDPKISEALGAKLLDLNNPGDEPNDGIMYTADEYFHAQKPTGVTLSKAGVPVASTRSYTYLDHMTNPKSDAAGLLAVCGLFHKRKVVITLAEFELFDDLEKDNPLDFKQQGEPPAEVAAEVHVRYDPYVNKAYGKKVLVHQALTAHRSADMFTVKQKATIKPGLILFGGPVLDGMKELKLDLLLLEMDWYPRFGVKEWLFDAHQQLAAWSGQVALKDGTFEIKSKHARAVIKVAMHDMY